MRIEVSGQGIPGACIFSLLETIPYCLALTKAMVLSSSGYGWKFYSLWSSLISHQVYTAGDASQLENEYVIPREKRRVSKCRVWTSGGYGGVGEREITLTA
ncbi:Hypothetical protein NTJ_07302 [Nesidiocoris tenuis]|uniref:Uncharacterized protein n=1 Tax=Nesidiocoris tenuis TaxID=355587 RepID=A0ABN7ARC8_9HEMI|nr:Hypothetical protein NTJ_07302 [Nesidiocoris tenuis]